jgi:GntR family transcriptional regulator
MNIGANPDFVEARAYGRGPDLDELRAAAGNPRVAEMLAAQLKDLIARGEYEAGVQLPTVNSLAGYLRINRNTVASAYRQLERQGLVESTVGRGTFVADSEVVRRERGKRELFRVADESLEKAYKLGFEPQEFVEAVTAAAQRVGLKAGGGPIRALFIECSLTESEFFAREIEEHANISVVPVDLEEFRADDSLRFRLLRLSDLVVTTFFHIQEVREIAGEQIEVVALGVGFPLQMLMELANLPPGTKVALICSEERCLRNLEKSVTNAGVEGLDIRYVTRLDSASLKKAARQVDRLFACRMTMKQLEDDGLLDSAPISLFNQTLDRSGLEMIREQVERIRTDASPPDPSR